MEIRKKIDEVRNKILAGDTALANKLAEQGIAAMFAGMHRPFGTPTTQWRNLMNNFINSDTELNRLCGMDPEFNKSRWGMPCIAYIAGNSTCTAETANATGTLRGMSLEMIKNLDADGASLKNFGDVETDSAFTEAFKNTDSKSPEINVSNDEK